MDVKRIIFSKTVLCLLLGWQYDVSLPPIVYEPSKLSGPQRQPSGFVSGDAEPRTASGPPQSMNPPKHHPNARQTALETADVILSYIAHTPSSEITDDRLKLIAPQWRGLLKLHLHSHAEGGVALWQM